MTELAKILQTQGPLGLALVVQSFVIIAMANQLINKTVSRSLFDAMYSGGKTVCHIEHADVVEKLDEVLKNQARLLERVK